jgi:hypothetical protein
MRKGEHTRQEIIRKAATIFKVAVWSWAYPSGSGNQSFAGTVR